MIYCEKKRLKNINIWDFFLFVILLTICLNSDLNWHFKHVLWDWTFKIKKKLIQMWAYAILFVKSMCAKVTEWAQNLEFDELLVKAKFEVPKINQFEPILTTWVI